MTEGKIRTETHDRIFKIIIDNPAKKNAFSPAMMEQLSDALTELHNNESYWVGVICAEGKDFTAGLDMPKFFGPNAEKRNFKEGNVDYSACKALQKADRHRGARHRLHHRHRTDAGGRHRRCRRRQPVLPDGIQARHCAARWRAFPLPVAHRLGQRDVSLFLCENSRHRAPARSAWSRRWCRRASRSSARWRSRRSLRGTRRSASR